MAYEFKKLSEVESLNEVPEGATVLAEVDGDIKRVPSSGLGGSSSSSVEYDLEISCNSRYGSINSKQITAGSVSSVITKIKNSERPNIKIVHTNTYSEFTYTAIINPCSVMVVDNGSLINWAIEIMYLLNDIHSNTNINLTKQYSIIFYADGTPM